MGHVYGLSSSRDNELRYVGMTQVPLAKRLKQHRSRANQGRPQHVSLWIRKERADGYKITIFSIQDGLDYESACALEIELIREYRQMGVRLTNSSGGGDGWSGEMSPEYRARLRDSARKRWEDPEKRQRLIAALHSPEARAKQADTLRERFKDPAARLKTSLATKRGLTAEGIQRRALATSRRYGYDGPPEARPCIICGNDFTPEKHEYLTCGGACKNTLIGIRARERHAAKAKMANHE